MTKIAFAGVRAPQGQRGTRSAPAPSPAPEDAPVEAAAPLFIHVDVLELVLKCLDVPDLARAAQTSREWRVASAAADHAWRRAFEAEFGAEKAVDFALLRTWRDKYM